MCSPFVLSRTSRLSCDQRHARLQCGPMHNEQQMKFLIDSRHMLKHAWQHYSVRECGISVELTYCLSLILI